MQFLSTSLKVLIESFKKTLWKKEKKKEVWNACGLEATVIVRTEEKDTHHLGTGTEVSSIKSSPADTSATFLIPKARKKKITRQRETEVKITHWNLLGKGIYINYLISLLYDAWNARLNVVRMGHEILGHKKLLSLKYSGFQLWTYAPAKTKRKTFNLWIETFRQCFFLFLFGSLCVSL